MNAYSLQSILRVSKQSNRIPSYVLENNILIHFIICKIKLILLFESIVHYFSPLCLRFVLEITNLKDGFLLVVTMCIAFLHPLCRFFL